MPAWVSSPVHRSIIASLVKARISAGLTQRELASKLGKPPSFVGKVESIERNLSALELVAWAAAIGIEPSVALPVVKGPIEL
ncbi:helix-turn-helix domain-containing protein [Brevundimonas vesicularis]|uniref:helix-turn-helix domain-containing protein n=1 Tax=Brevundimonas vesicularis TaxID=41276 RepID=UPI00384AC3C1